MKIIKTGKYKISIDIDFGIYIDIENHCNHIFSMSIDTNGIDIDITTTKKHCNHIVQFNSTTHVFRFIFSRKTFFWYQKIVGSETVACYKNALQKVK